MSRTRSLAVGSLLVGAVACGDGGSSTAGSGGSGSGATGGLGSNTGGMGTGGASSGGTGAVSTGGTGAVGRGSGGVGGGTGGDGNFVKPAYTCPSGGGAPATPVESGRVPTLAVVTAVGADETDLLGSSVALADGSAALIVITSSPGRTLGMAATGEETCVLYRVSVDGEVTPVVSWPHELGTGAVVAGDPEGNLVVAGVAHASFTAGDVAVTRSSDGDGFVYLLDVSASNEVSAGPSFAFTGALSLTSLLNAPDGSLALAGSLTGRLDVGGRTINSPAFDTGPLEAAFVARLDARRTLTWHRVFHATGVDNDPPALEGTGGSFGFGRSTITDLAFAPDDALVASTVFSGTVDLDDLRLPNDGLDDGVVVKLDQAGDLMWTQHIYGRIGAYYIHPVGPEGSGGISGTSSGNGAVSRLRVDVDVDGRVAVTAGLDGHAVVSGRDLDGGSMLGHLSALFDADGTLLDALPEGGGDVAFGASGDVVVWDGTTLFGPALNGAAAWSLAPGGQLLGSEGGLLQMGPEGLWVTGAFIGTVDLGSGPLAPDGCADAFAARFRP